MSRIAKLREIFENIEPEQRELVSRLISEVDYLERQMDEYKKLPFIRVHPDDPSRQKTTAAAKLYKEASQSYMNAIRILSGILRRTETSAADDLAKLLEEYT